MEIFQGVKSELLLFSKLPFFDGMIWKLTTLHAEFTNLLVVGIFVELHSTGEDEGQPGGKTIRYQGICKRGRSLKSACITHLTMYMIFLLLYSQM